MKRIPESWLILGPGALYLGVFFLIPMLIVAGYSLLEPGPYGGTTGGFTWDNYRALAQPDYLLIVWRSIRLAGWTTVLCLLIAYPVAWTLSRLPAGHQAGWIFVLTLPAWLNLLIKNYAWLILLRKEGPLNTWLQAAGITQAPVEMLFTEGAVILGLVHTYLPFMILPLYVALERIDGRLIEAARDLGGNGWQVFWRVILPQSHAGLRAGLTLVMVPALGSFLTPDLLGGAGAMMIGSLIQEQFFVARNWPLGAALAMTCMALIAGTLRFSRRDGPSDLWQ
ncbi:MAG: ABC transporter permease [Bacteroidia bacterium]|nr:ABC transporter permease [Bacteroidia bacterium]